MNTSQTMSAVVVIVTYRGSNTIEETVACALGMQSASSVFVIDNASDDDTMQKLHALRCSRLHVIRNASNIGVAAAYNQGIEKAAAVNASWMMVLDQDSRLKNDTLRQLLDAVETLVHQRGERNLGAVFPSVRCLSYPEVFHYPMNWTGSGFQVVTSADAAIIDSTFIEVDTSISSGALYSVAALKSIGGFQEDYFIDFVDHHCHLRLRRAGYHLFWVRHAEVLHELGMIQQMTDTGLWIEHAPFRYYYMARNMAVGYWALGGIRALIGLGREIRNHIMRMRRYGRQPKACEYYLLLGLRDAFLGRKGRLPDR